MTIRSKQDFPTCLFYYEIDRLNARTAGRREVTDTSETGRSAIAELREQYGRELANKKRGRRKRGSAASRGAQGRGRRRNLIAAAIGYLLSLLFRRGRGPKGKRV